MTQIYIPQGEFVPRPLEIYRMLVDLNTNNPEIRGRQWMYRRVLEEVLYDLNKDEKKFEETVKYVNSSSCKEVCELAEVGYNSFTSFASQMLSNGHFWPEKRTSRYLSGSF